MDLKEKRVDVYREPRPDGYAQVRHLRRGANLDVLAIAGLTVGVDEVLG